MSPTPQQITAFREVVWKHFRNAERAMPWRESPTPYYVLVSELMLQQTQVSRVTPKFEAFITHFPTIASLADASLAEVLRLWNGLGYNRRAKFLWTAAQIVEQEFDGKMPNSADELMRLPGVGPNTAGAILAYAYDQPVVFVETNIRTVYFHHFFEGQAGVSDKQLREYVGVTLDREHPRQWYWALMDYGAYLKRQEGARLDQSKHYKKQSPLKGSLREMRGRIIKALVGRSLAEKVLQDVVSADERFIPALDGLIMDGLVERQNSYLRLTGGNDPR